MKRLLLAIVATLGLLGATQAQASPNLVTNGDFSAGGTGWNLSTCCRYFDGAYHEGNVGGDGVIYQTIATPAGASLLLTYDFFANSGGYGYTQWNGFTLPVEGARLSARFGGQRILNGEPKRPHYGADLAAPIGTPVRAPAPGQVCFAETNMHFDGSLVLIDHGQGLISCYLHLSRVDAVVGQTVARGDLIGAVGMEGRATGPHLCWRLKWRGRNLDPMLMVGAKAPV